jgi:hypothetical protein
MSRSVERAYNFNLDGEFCGPDETSHLTTYGVTNHRTQYGAEDLQWTTYFHSKEFAQKNPSGKLPLPTK